MEITLSIYKELLNRLDWHYDFSDSLRVYLAGEAAYAKLFDIAKANGDEFKLAFNEAYLKAFPSTTFVNVKVPFEVDGGTLKHLEKFDNLEL